MSQKQRSNAPYAPQREEYSDRASNNMTQGTYNANTNTNTTTTTRPTTTAARREKHRSRKNAQPQRRAGCCGVLQCMTDAAMRVIHTIVPPGGILSGAFNMASGSIGAGILGLPSAGDSAGLVLGVIYLVIITYFSVFSMYILALAAQSTRIKSFEGMARWLFPSGNFAFSYWAAFIRWFHAFAGCVAYIISVGNCLGPIFKGALAKHPDNSAIEFFAGTQGLRVLTVIIWACVMIPMVVPKHIDSLRYASAIAITFMVYFVIVVVVHSCRHGLPENRHNVELVGNQENDSKLIKNTVFLFRTGNSVVHTVGVFMFAYVCQINAYEVFWDFRPEIRTTKNYTWSAFIGMLLCGILYLMVCIFGYFDFGSKNLLGKSLLLMYDPLNEADVMIAYVGVLIKLCVAYALLTIAARNSVYYMIGFQHRYRNRGPGGSSNTNAVITSPADSEELAMQRQQQQRSSNDDLVMKPTSTRGAAGNAVVEPDQDGLVDDFQRFDEADDVSCGGVAGPRGKKAVPQDVADDVAEDGVDKDFADNTAEDTTYVDNIPFWQHLIVVLALSVASLLCGLFIPNINTVFGFAGAISGGFLAFVFPALFFMYSGNFSVAQVGWFTYLNTYLLLICGVIGIIFGTGGTIYETI